MRLIRVLVVTLLLCTAFSARAEEAYYDPQRAGHPIRIAAYVLHPVGVLIDYLLLRPAWWVGQREPARTIFGVQAERPDDPRGALD
jgi:hypothetical protein